MRIIGIFPLLASIAVLPALAHAQTPTRSASDAAKAFNLDLTGADTAAPSADTKDTPPTAKPSEQPVPVTGAGFTLDTPIAQLIADPRSKAVLDRDLPGLSDDSNLSRFRLMSLRQFQPMTGGQLSTALLEKTGMDLAAIGGAPTPVTMPAPLPMVPAATANNRHSDSGR